MHDGFVAFQVLHEYNTPPVEPLRLVDILRESLPLPPLPPRPAAADRPQGLDHIVRRTTGPEMPGVESDFPDGYDPHVCNGDCCTHPMCKFSVRLGFVVEKAKLVIERVYSSVCCVVVVGG